MDSFERKNANAGLNSFFTLPGELIEHFKDVFMFFTIHFLNYINLFKKNMLKNGYYRKRRDPRLSCKDDTGCCLLVAGQLSIRVFKGIWVSDSESIWTEFFLERIILMQSFFIQSLYPWKKLTRRNERHLEKKLCTYIIREDYNLGPPLWFNQWLGLGLGLVLGLGSGGPKR